MQDALFPDDRPTPPTAAPVEAATPRRAGKVQACAHAEALVQLARALPEQVHLGGSSWSYPGWAGLTYEHEHSEAVLAKHGLTAYAQHPLFRSVCLDRAFYRALTALQYAQLAAQVPADFRFVVKAPLAVTDATVRGENGRALQANPLFLNVDMAVSDFVQPALDGLGAKIGALVFQLSPLPLPLLANLPEVLSRLRALLLALPALKPLAPDGVIAVEVRDREFLTPAFADVLRECGATYCLGLQAKMPPITEQLPLLRALWPGPLVCRWHLSPRHGAYGYEAAEKRYAPFNQLLDPDPETRDALARVIAATAAAGHKAYVSISNQAEGCAPLSALELARTLVR